MRNILQRQELQHGLTIERSRDVRNLQQCFEFTGKCQPTIFHAIIEWLLARSITRDHQPLSVGVPDREGKHATQMFDKIQSMLFIEMDNDFGVTVGAELVSGIDQLPSELNIIVDFTVKRNLHGVVFVAQRLCAAGDVDDTQAPMPKCYSRHTRRR